MKVVNVQTQQLEDVTPEEAQASFVAGTHNLVAGKPVTIRTADGALGQVDPNDAQLALSHGATLADDAEFRKAQLDAHYGGLGHAAVAMGEGVARGLTFGAIDPLAVGAAKLLGSPQAAEAVRSHLAAEKEEHPWAAGGGELLGAALPAIASGGTAVPEDAAALGAAREAAALGAARAAPEIAGAVKAADAVAAPVAEATTAAAPVALDAEAAAPVAETVAEVAATPRARALRKLLGYTPAGLSSKLGASAEDFAYRKILQAPTADAAIKRIGIEALKSAAAAGVESIPYGLGSEWSEDTLGNTDVTAEKLIAAAGHAGIYGVLLGGGGSALLRGASEAARPLFAHAAPSMSKAAANLYFRDVNNAIRFTRQAETAGGPVATATTWIKRGMLPTDVSEAASMTPVQRAEKFRFGTEIARGELEDALRQLGAIDRAKISAAELSDAIKKEVIAPLARGGATAADAEYLNKLHDNILDAMGAGYRPEIKPTELPNEERLWHALEPTKADAERAVSVSGGKAIGQTLSDAGIKVPDADSDFTDLVASIRDKEDAARQRLAKLRKDAVDSTSSPATAQHLWDLFESRIAPLRQGAATSNDAAAIEKFRDDMLERLGGAARVRISPEPPPRLPPNVEAWRALEPTQAATAKAERTAGGATEIGNELVKAGIEPPAPHGDYEKFSSDIDKWVNSVGEQIGELAESAGAEGHVPLRAVTAAIDEVIRPLQGKALHEGVLRSMIDAKGSILESLGATLDRKEANEAGMLAAKASGHHPGTEEWQSAFAMAKADDLDRQLEEHGHISVPFERLLETRKAVDVMAYKEAKALDPKLRVEYLRRIRTELAGLELDALSHASGLEASDAYKDLKKTYQRGMIAQELAENARLKRVRGRGPKPPKEIPEEFGPLRLLPDRPLSADKLAAEKEALNARLYPRGTPQDGIMYHPAAVKTRALRAIAEDIEGLELRGMRGTTKESEYAKELLKARQLKMAERMAENVRLRRERGFYPKIKPPEFGPMTAIPDKDIVAAELTTQRSLLGDKVFPRGTPEEGFLVQDGNPRAEGARKIHQILSDAEQEAMRRGVRKTPSMPQDSVDKLLQLQKEYARMRIGQDMSADSAARAATNHRVGLLDMMSHGGGGAAGAVIGAMTGHLGAGAALGSAATWIGREAHRFARTKGNTIAAVALNKLANLDMLARANRVVDKDIDAAIASGLRGSKPRVRLRRFSGPDDSASPEEKYQHGYNLASSYRAVTDDHVSEVLPGLAAHAPKTAQSTLKTLNSVSAFLAASRPKPLNGPTLADPDPKPRTDDISASNYHEIRKAAEDPAGTLSHGIETGKITRAQVTTIKTTFPNLFDEVQRKLVEELAKPRKEPLSAEKLTMLSTLFGVAADPSMDAAHVAVYQSAFAPSGPSPTAEDTGTPPKNNPVQRHQNQSAVNEPSKSTSLALNRVDKY